MKKLDLSDYSGKEIVDAIFNMPLNKFLFVLGAISSRIENISTIANRGAEGIDEDELEDLVERLMGK